MADAIISAIIGDVVGRAISLLVGRFSNQESTEDKLQRISHLLIRIHSVVEEAKRRQISNHGILQWLSELIDSEYQGFYLLDSIRCGNQEARQCADKVVPQVSTFSLFNPAKRVRVAGCTMRSASWCQGPSVDEIDRVLKRLQGMSCDIMEFIMLLQNCQLIRRPLGTNIFREGQMFGRHVEKESVINFLLHDDDQSTGDLDVLPIVGTNGIGKTTLVQHACDDARVRNHFLVILLYSFSCIYDVKKNEGAPNDPVEYVKRNSFCDKRCLMVFEDVDIHRKQILEEFMQSLRCSKEGSKVIVTTNSQRLANIGTVEPIILTALPCPEYWFFFKVHAFAGRDMEDNPRLIAAGKEIAMKLNGSFFGAKMVGGVLRDHPDSKFWRKVVRSNIGGVYPVGDCIHYISDLVDSLLPGHVDLCKVTVSKGPFPPDTTELARLKDLCSAIPHGSMMTCWADDARFTKVLLSKSVLPFFNQYYIAHCSCIARCSCSCTVGSANSCS
ncbi:unnamed protein product [Urochloa decumbens]|uniref:Disease resistance N-terminal domain-containing protein n=1 Tax=Urochloa decumbens TaxID=240449 RepID=A0ABC8VZ52_9POAL